MVHKFENLDKTNQFLERHKLPKLTQQEIGNVNKSVSVEEIESIITFQNRKHQTQMSSLVNFTKHLKKQNASALKSLSEDRSREHCLTHFLRPALFLAI